MIRSSWLLILALTFVGCSTPSLRGPASIDAIPFHFDQIRPKLDSFITNFIAAQRELRVFDQELKAIQADSSDFNLTSLRSYARLQALRELRHRQIDLLMGQFKFAAGRMKSTQLLATEKSELKDELKKLQEYFGNLSTIQLLSFRELMLAIKEDKSTAALVPGAPIGLLNQSEKMELGQAMKTVKKDESLDRQVESLAETWLYAHAKTVSNLDATEIKVGSSVTGRELREQSGDWMLTLDDGPGANTIAMLNMLKQKEVKANFFIVGKNQKRLPAVLLRAQADGHAFGSHSMTHSRLTLATESELELEITDAVKLLSGELKTDVSWYRVPYGSGYREEKVVKSLKRNRLVHVLWNVDSIDWQDPLPESIVERTKLQMSLVKNRGIILFHDVHAQTLKAVEKLINDVPRIQWKLLDEVYQIEEQD